MIDLHAHILPAIDDGPKTAKEAAALVKELAAQGVRVIVATPHYLPYRESVDSFLKRRDTAAEKLRQELSDFPDAPKIILGSEVLFNSSIFNDPDLYKLCIQGTNKLLLEFPYSTALTKRLLQHMIRFSAEKEIVPVLAHIERYNKLFFPKGAIEQLLDHDCLLQISCDAILSLRLRFRIKSLLKREMLHAIGSDTHNLTTRPPRWTASLEKLEKACDKKYFKSLLTSQKIWQ